MSGGSSVRVDRVVAVAAVLRDGREQLGSGYLVAGRLALTAEHCTRDKATGELATGLRVVRASDGAVADVIDVVSDHGLDVAVLRLADGAPWETDFPPPMFARVDQSESGVLDDCAGIGFPLFQRDPDRRTRHTSEFHGRIYQTDEWESGRLVMREPLIHPGPVAKSGGEEALSPWGGLSGALMFYRGSAVGVVVEHHPRQGDSALTAIGFGRIAASVKIRECLQLPEPDSLPCVNEHSATPLAPAGWPLAEVTDPFALEVHRPVQPESLQPGLPVLPPYVPRDHDAALGSVVRAAVEGSSGIAVLVGGSSTGKTRACWEALRLLRDQPERWRLWHPIDPARPDAALRDLDRIGSRTVIWLNESQFYLNTADDVGERVAAGLRELLRDPVRAPILVLGSMWPEYWEELSRPRQPSSGKDPHAQARALLDGNTISVPGTFTGSELAVLGGVQSQDPRLAKAAEHAEGGQIAQYLAGVPALLERYRNAPPAARAIIDAAIDARRLGHGLALPQALLAAAAPGYLSDSEWDSLADDWIKQAIAYTSVPCKGVRGPVTPIRPRTTPGPVPSAAGWEADEDSPRYRLADYLEQTGRHDRDDHLPPTTFWDAIALHATDHDRFRLGEVAKNQGLYRHAACLWAKATASGHPEAARALIGMIRLLDPAAVNQVSQWAAERIDVDNPGQVVPLLKELHEAAVSQATETLANRAAAHTPLTNIAGLCYLLESFRIIGADQAVAILTNRDSNKVAAWYAPGSLAWMIRELRCAGIINRSRGLELVILFLMSRIWR